MTRCFVFLLPGLPSSLTLLYVRYLVTATSKVRNARYILNGRENWSQQYPPDRIALGIGNCRTDLSLNLLGACSVV